MAALAFRLDDEREVDSKGGAVFAEADDEVDVNTRDIPKQPLTTRYK